MSDVIVAFVRSSGELAQRLPGLVRPAAYRIPRAAYELGLVGAEVVRGVPGDALWPVAQTG